jgi:DNA-methyltransferase (dcm)
MRTITKKGAAHPGICHLVFCKDSYSNPYVAQFMKYPVNPMNEIIFGEFFSGPGGMSQGALMAQKDSSGQPRMRSAWAVDYDPYACATYHRNIHKGEGALYHEGSETLIPGINKAQGQQPIVLNADVRNVDVNKLNAVDAFLFGFPCNDFSNVGETKGLDGDFGPLYKQGIRLIKAKNPLFFVAENVSGLVHANDYGAFIQIIEDLHLRELGEDKSYVVTPHHYKFEDYGIPQTRHRVIIVGIRADVARNLKRPFLPPAPTFVYKTARQAFDEISPDAPNNAPKPLSARVLERLQYIEPGQNIWDVNENIPEHLRLHVKGTHISSIYKVIDPDKPAYTVTGSGGGGTHMYHWDKRATTDRERAKLQTFPDDFVFEGSMTAVRKQIGMAVPPEGAKIIINAVLNTLDGIEYEYTEPNLTKELDPVHVEKKRAARQRFLEKRLAKRAAEDAEAAAAASLTSIEVEGENLQSEVKAIQNDAEDPSLEAA